MIYYEALTLDLSERVIEAILVEIPKVFVKEGKAFAHIASDLNQAEHHCEIEASVSPGGCLTRRSLSRRKIGIQR